jgi:hypothetical protein
VSEPENFVARWSRLKREDAKERADAAQAPGPSEQGREPDEAAGGVAEPAPAGAQPSPPFDEASLPPIESITAGSDIRAFLQKGVPGHLTRAALRRAWTTDPAIRDFIGIAENQWDFTDPNAMPGFGPLAPTDDVGKLVAQAMGKLGEVGEAAAADAPPAEPPTPASTAALPSPGAGPGAGAQAQPLGMPGQMQGAAEQSTAVDAQQSGDIAASQHVTASAERSPAGNRRGHGSALPE